jgi:hypothetical protein
MWCDFDVLGLKEYQMEISWGKIVQVAPTLWARLGYEGNDLSHLMSGAENEIQQLKGIHYWKLVGRWYVQQSDPITSDYNRDLLSPRRFFVETLANCDDIVRMIQASAIVTSVTASP